MDEIQDENQDSILEQSTTEIVETADSEAGEPDVETLKQQVADLEEKNKQLYARVKKEKPKENLPTNTSSDKDELIDLRLEGYSKTEAEFIIRNGGRKALEDPLIMGAIETGRKKAKSVDATPTGTGKSTVFQKFTEQDLRRMSAEELEKIVPQ